MFLVHDVSLDGTPVSCRNDLRLSSRATSSTLSLYANQLTGPFVDGFGALTRLVNLNLANNALVGSFPSCIPLMTALTYEVPRSANGLPDTSQVAGVALSFPCSSARASSLPRRRAGTPFDAAGVVLRAL